MFYGGCLERGTRFELATNSVEGCDSTVELPPLGIDPFIIPRGRRCYPCPIYRKIPSLTVGALLRAQDAFAVNTVTTLVGV